MGIYAFHAANRRRQAEHPHGMLATSTHDTKRGEDGRARIAAIADHPTVWKTAIRRWRELLPAVGIDQNDLYFFFQLLLGGWPHANHPDGIDGLTERLVGAMIKSIREGRCNSDWNVPNEKYELAVGRFIAESMANPAFLADFAAVSKQLSPAGQRKSLAQTTLKLTIPGVPDIYRGAEDWEQSFVDPDNRRPVDFSALARRLDASHISPADRKLRLTQLLLKLRRTHPDLLADGIYEPISSADDVLAFSRVWNGQELRVFVDLAITPRHFEEVNSCDNQGFSSLLIPLAASPFHDLGIEVMLRT
jgi:(1->4)-alpha-D-glucan 1-alpha-D-glucosylmutase